MIHSEIPTEAPRACTRADRRSMARSMMDRKHIRFTLGHELLCAAGGVVAGAMLAWFLKPTAGVFVNADSNTSSDGFDDPFDHFGDASCSITTKRSDGGGDYLSPSGQQTGELVDGSQESERMAFEERLEKEVEELERLHNAQQQKG